MAGELVIVSIGFLSKHISVVLWALSVFRVFCHVGEERTWMLSTMVVGGGRNQNTHLFDCDEILVTEAKM